MNELPDFLRTATWHPLLVHLPLSLLLIGTIGYLFGFLGKRKFWMDFGIVLLFAGTIGAWAAVYTGEMADGAVARQLCDPTILKIHDNSAHTVSWLFSIASALVIVDFTGLGGKMQRAARLAIVLLMLTGSGFLVRTGHLGATLVYQQAAGVYIPSEDCEEFY